MTRIEPARRGELGEIARLLSTCDLPTDDLTDEMLDHFLAAREPGGEAIVGTVGLEVLDGTALVRSLAVSPAHRGQGVATELLRRIEAHAASIGLSEIHGLTVTAEAFLSARGFVRIDRAEAPAAIRETAQFRRLCPETAVCVVKRLSPRPSDAGIR